MHCQRTIPTLVITATISIKPALTKPAPPTNQRFPLEICNQDGSRYATLALQHTRRTSGTAQETWKLFERATPKVKFKAIDVRVLYATVDPCRVARLIYRSAHARLNPVSVPGQKTALNEESYVCDLASTLSGRCLFKMKLPIIRCPAGTSDC